MTPRQRQVRRALATRERQVARLLDLEAFKRLLVKRRGAPADLQLFGRSIDVMPGSFGHWIAVVAYAESSHGHVEQVVHDVREFGGPRLDTLARDMLHGAEAQITDERTPFNRAAWRVDIRYVLTERSALRLKTDLFPFAGLSRKDRITGLQSVEVTDRRPGPPEDDLEYLLRPDSTGMRDVVESVG